MERHTTLERVVARRANEKCLKDSDFNPSVVDTVIGVGESATKKLTVGLHKSVHEEQSVSGPVAKRHWWMVKNVREWARSQPAQGQRQRQGKTSRKNGTTTRTKLDLRMKMDSARWVILVLNVRELNLQVMSKFCVQKCKSVVDSTELPSSSKRVSDGSGEQRKFDQSTGEVLFAAGCRDDRPIVDSGSAVSTCPVDYATSLPTEKVHNSKNLECVG